MWIMGDWVHMGGFSGTHQFCQVGAHAFIANNTAVTRDVPPFVMAVGRPADPHSVNSEGLKRRGYSAEQIRNIRDAYRILYRSQLKLAEATDQIEQRAQTQPELQPLVDFLNDSTPRRERVGHRQVAKKQRIEWLARRRRTRSSFWSPARHRATTSVPN